MKQRNAKRCARSCTQRSPFCTSVHSCTRHSCLTSMCTHTVSKYQNIRLHFWWFRFVDTAEEISFSWFGVPWHGRSSLRIFACNGHTMTTFINYISSHQFKVFSITRAITMKCHPIKWIPALFAHHFTGCGFVHGIHQLFLMQSCKLCPFEPNRETLSFKLSDVFPINGTQHGTNIAFQLFNSIDRIA